MTLDYTTKGLCKVRMLDYIEEVIKTFNKTDQKSTGTKTSAAPSNLFVVKEDCTKLTKEKSEHFTAWWQRCYLIPRELGRTPAHQSHF